MSRRKIGEASPDRLDYIGAQRATEIGLELERYYLQHGGIIRSRGRFYAKDLVSNQNSVGLGQQPGGGK